MSKGTAIYYVRLPATLVELTQATIALRGLGKSGKQWTLSDFIRVAMAEKILKMNRSRRRAIDSPAAEQKRRHLHSVGEDESAELETSPEAIGGEVLAGDTDSGLDLRIAGAMAQGAAGHAATASLIEQGSLSKSGEQHDCR